MIHKLAPKASNRENLTIQCAAGAPPHVPVGTRSTHFTSKLEEYRSSVAIPLAWNVCARHFRDVTQSNVTCLFLNGRVAWISLAIDLPPTKENRTIRHSSRNRQRRTTWESSDGCDALSPGRRRPLFPPHFVTPLPFRHFYLSFHTLQPCRRRREPSVSSMGEQRRHPR